MSIATPPPVPSAPPSLANAAGKSVRRSPLLWIFGAFALLTVFAAIGLVVIILAYNAGAARRVSPSTRTIAPSVFAQSLPVIPIKLGVHKAAWGEGYVVTFVNDGERYLKFTVTHKRTTLNQGGTFELRLQPNTSVEQGWNEGHTFYPGDTVIIEHPEFSRREIIVDPSQKVGFRLVTGTL